MDPLNRYQVLDKIAEGEYATIFRAQDLELRREVAIKQIHPQYLQDPAQLERYWQEAQLLASLDHPYILTVYDIVRPRGWLILELMQGSIAQQLRGQPIDLDFLRVTLICGLHALRVLSQNQIVHGDVKPGNLLLDRANRVKLGDFGIARRLSGEEGSLIKGTTKYMAPEVVSDQFGPIGAHSDLYSLGFTAYELMCGSHFDMLFPGLDMYGGNRQMAWIMWHAALDRRLPEINRVLEGVPEDLVHVIQKLTEKDPARRYRTPDEALADLRTKAQLPGAVSPVAVEEAAAEEVAAAASARRKRIAMYAALAVSMLLSAVMVFIPAASNEPPTTQTAGAEPQSGILRHVDLKRNNFFLETPTGEQPPGIPFNPEFDRVFLDDQKVSLADLRQGDTIEVRRLVGEHGQPILEIQASRDVDTDEGAVATVDATLGRLTIALPSADGSSENLLVDVPPSARITFNGEEQQTNGQPFTLKDIKAADAVVVRHLPSEGRRRATSVAAQRIVTLSGTVAGVDVAGQKLSIRPASEGGNSLPRELPLSPDTTIRINGKTEHAEKPFALADLVVGDRVVAQHNAALVQVEVSRKLDHAGAVQSVDLQQQHLTVKLDDPPGKIVPFRIMPETRWVIPGREDRTAPVLLDMLRPGDKVSIAHNSPDLSAAQATQVQFSPVADSQLWAVIIGVQQYEDSRLDPLSTARGDAERLRDVLLDYRRAPANQVLTMLDATRAEIERSVPSFLEKVASGSQLIIYYAGHGYLDENGKPTLAPRDFDPTRMEQSGIALRWLIAAAESTSAKEKLLLLDCSHAGESPYAARQPSAAEFAEALRTRAGRPLSASVTIITSSSQGERGQIAPSSGAGRFAAATAAAFKGSADVNGDQRVQGNELFASVKSELATSAAGGQQTPAMFLPDATPERLSEEARQGVRQLLAYLGRNQIDARQVQVEYDRLQPLAPNQPDFKLAAGLVLLKHGKTSFSTQMFESALALAPQSPLAHQSLAWQALTRKDNTDGTKHLQSLLESMASMNGEAATKLTPYEQHVLNWTGKLAAYLKEFEGSDGSRWSAQLASVAARRGEAAEKAFLAGAADVSLRKKALVEEFQLAGSEDAKNQLRFKAKLLTTYVQFDFDEAERALLAQLEQ